jgi:hypothetical protein
MKPLLLLILGCATLSAQPVEGCIFDSVTGAPVAGAYVAIHGATFNDRILRRSDTTGHFRIEVPDAARGKLIAVSRPGYLIAHEPVASLPADGSPLRIELTPEAVISGTLEDEDGFAVEAALVEALHWENGKLTRAGTATRSNDLGGYRIAELPAGRYYLRVAPPSGSLSPVWDRRYVPQFYPGLLEANDDNVLGIEADQQRTLSFRLRKYEGVTISGQLIVPPGAGAADVTRFVYARSVDVPDFGAGPALADAKTGHFTITHIPPGTWVLTSNARGGRVVARQTVQVGTADVTGVVLTIGDPANQGEAGQH